MPGVHDLCPPGTFLFVPLYAFLFANLLLSFTCWFDFKNHLSRVRVDTKNYVVRFRKRFRVK